MHENILFVQFAFMAKKAHCNKNPIYVFLLWEMRGLSPYFYIHVSVSDLYIPRIGPHISCSRIGRSFVGIYKSLTETHECGNWDCGSAIPVLGIFVSNFQHWFFAVEIGTVAVHFLFLGISVSNFQRFVSLQCGVLNTFWRY
jgi:hypothetical protein